MKNKTVISISVFIFMLCTVQSCERDDMNLAPEISNLGSKGSKQNLLLKAEKDTLQMTTNILLDRDGNEIKDPPPKDKDQWKQKL